MFPLAQKEHLIIPAHIDHLANLREFIVQIGQKYGYSHKLVNAFKLAVDEAATNIIEHAYGDQGGYITVQAVIRSNALTINLTDQGAYFDPNWLAAPDLQQHVEHGKKGGLGIFMMRKLLDDVSYDKTEAGNRLSLTKNDPSRKGFLHLKRLWELPPTLRFKYFAQAVFLVTLVNAAGFAYFYFNSGNESRQALDRLGKQISRQISEQIGAVNASLLNGPDGLSYVQGLTEPVRADHEESVLAISLEDSLGYVGWSTVKNQLTQHFSRPENATLRKPDVYEYTLDNGVDVVEYQRPISRSERPVAFQKVHVFLTRSYEQHQLSQIRLRYLKTACIALGASYILLAFVSYLLSYPVRKLNEWIRAARKGDVSGYLDVDASSGIGEIAQAFSDIADEIGKSQKHLARSERIEKEIKIAQDIQESLLPTSVPTLETLDIAARYEAAESVGGDYYDFIEVDQNHLGIVLADVSGKGVPGSLIMTMVRTALRTEARGATDAADVLIRVNDFVKNDMKSGIFVTMLYLIVDTRSHAVSFANAGHTPLIVHRGRTGQTYYLNPDGFPVGLKLPGEQTFEDSIKSEKLRIEAGDTLLLYTDGVTEAMNDKQVAFGKERLLQFIRKQKEARLDDFCEKLRHEIYSFRENLPPQDDITFVAIRAHASIDEDAVTEPMIEEGMSLESRFLSQESVTQILDVVAQHPEYDAGDISDELNSEPYGFTVIEPGRIQAELLRQNIATRPKRRDFIKSVEAQTRNLEPPATPKLTLSGDIKLEDSLPEPETAKPEKQAKKKRKKKKPKRSLKKKKQAAAAPEKTEPVAEIEAPSGQPDETAEADFVLGEFIDELFSKAEEQDASALEAQKEVRRPSDPEAQADPVAGNGPEAPATENEGEIVGPFSDDDLSDSLVDSLLDGLTKETPEEEAAGGSAVQVAETLENTEPATDATPAAETAPTASGPSDGEQPEPPPLTQERATPEAGEEADQEKAPPVPVGDESNEAAPDLAEQSVQIEAPEPDAASLPNLAKEKETQPLLLAPPAADEQTDEEIDQPESTEDRSSASPEATDADPPADTTPEMADGQAAPVTPVQDSGEHSGREDADEPDTAMAEQAIDSGSDAEDSEAAAPEPPIEQETPDDKPVPAPSAGPEAAEPQGDAGPGLDKSLLPSFIFTKIFTEEPEAEKAGEANGDAHVLVEAPPAESDDREEREASPAAEVDADTHATAPDAAAEAPDIPTPVSEPEAKAKGPTPVSEVHEAIAAISINKVEVTWQPQTELDWPELISHEIEDKYRSAPRRRRRPRKNGAATAETVVAAGQHGAQAPISALQTPAGTADSRSSAPASGSAHTETTANESPGATYDPVNVPKSEIPATADVTPDESAEVTSDTAALPLFPSQTTEIEVTTELLTEEAIVEPSGQEDERSDRATAASESENDPAESTAQAAVTPTEIAQEEMKPEPPAQAEEGEQQLASAEDAAETPEVNEPASAATEDITQSIEVSSEHLSEEKIDKQPEMETAQTVQDEQELARAEDAAEIPEVNEPASAATEDITQPIEVTSEHLSEEKVDDTPEAASQAMPATAPPPAQTPEVEPSAQAATESAAAQSSPNTGRPKSDPEPRPAPAAANENPDDVDALVRRGINCYKQKEFEDAIIFLNKALRLDEGFTDIYAMLGNAYFRNKMFAEAQQSYEILKEKGRATEAVCENLGLIYWKSGLKEAALKEWRSVVSANPEREDLARRIEQIEGDMRRARGSAEQSLAREAKQESAHHRDAASRGQNADRMQALSLLNEGIEQYKLGARDAAIGFFEQAIAMFPDKTEAYHYLGNAYFRNRMYDEAAEVFERLKKLDGDDLRSKENLALVRARQGDYAQAIREWQDVLQKEPGRLDLKNKIEKAAQLV